MVHCAEYVPTFEPQGAGLTVRADQTSHAV